MTNTCASTGGALVAQLIAAGTNILPVSADEHARVAAALNAFDLPGEHTRENTEAARIISGHINVTYALRRATGEQFIVQQMNPVFDLDAIDNNLRRLEQAQARARDAGLLPPHWQTVGYLNVAGGERKLHDDAEGRSWRVMHFVPGDIKIFNSFSEVPAAMRAPVAASLGEAIAVFGRMLDAVPGDVWQQPLPNFHNARYHLGYLREVLAGGPVTLSLCRDAARQVRLNPDFLRAHRARVDALREKVEARAHLATCLDTLARGVAHGDTKINNFVFRKDADGVPRCVCLIDLDTVQVGSVLDDLGDALRSAGNPAGEEPPRLEDVRIDADIVERITAGYLTTMRAYYGAERARELEAHARNAFAQFLYVQCTRFFADALVGNAYFKLKPGLPDEINLYRGEVQMRALEALEALHG